MFPAEKVNRMDDLPRYARKPTDFDAVATAIGQHNLRLSDAALQGRCMEAGLKAQLLKIERLERLVRTLTERLAKLEAKQHLNPVQQS